MSIVTYIGPGIFSFKRKMPLLLVFFFQVSRRLNSLLHHHEISDHDQQNQICKTRAFLQNKNALLVFVLQNGSGSGSGSGGSGTKIDRLHIPS